MPLSLLAKIQRLRGDRLHQPKIAVFIRNINRPRGRSPLKLFPLADHIDLFITQNRVQANFRRDYLGLPTNSLRLFLQQPTDISFNTYDGAILA
ncbi:MAG: hypothetical protein KME54_13745 [Tolypothrix brevis GSE-NOS-MK-07-07A]|nr:hypothetical protein [Tolypothrix brevis GSE-NOS-MK-07-07A]